MDWRSESVDPVRLLYLPLQKANEGSFHAMSRFINVSVYDFADLPHWLFIVPSALDMIFH